jgi:hypothetical protein
VEEFGNSVEFDNQYVLNLFTMKLSRKKLSNLDQADNVDERRVTQLLEHRVYLVDLMNDQLGIFDKSILTLSSGSLGLSVLYLEKIVKGHVVSEDFLFSGWAFFIIAIGLNLVSYKFAANDSNKCRMELDECLRKGLDYAPSVGFWGKLVRFCNYGSLAAFIAGASFFLFFAFNNVG